MVTGDSTTEDTICLGATDGKTIPARPEPSGLFNEGEDKSMSNADC